MSTILANKLDRKSLKRPDEFLALGRKLMGKLGDQSKSLVVGGGILLLVALAAGFLMNQSSRQEMDAQNALFLAKKKMATDKSTTDLEKVVSDYSGSRAAYDAALALGDNAFSTQDFTTARKWFEKSVAEAPRAFEKALAHYSLGYALEGSKEYALAADQFNKALNQGQPALKAEVLLSMARVQAMAGKRDDARKTYDRLIAEHAKTEEADRAEALKAKL